MKCSLSFAKSRRKEKEEEEKVRTGTYVTVSLGNIQKMYFFIDSSVVSAKAQFIHRLRKRAAAKSTLSCSRKSVITFPLPQISFPLRHSRCSENEAYQILTVLNSNIDFCVRLRKHLKMNSGNFKFIVIVLKLTLVGRHWFSSCNCEIVSMIPVIINGYFSLFPPKEIIQVRSRRQKREGKLKKRSKPSLSIYDPIRS